MQFSLSPILSVASVAMFLSTTLAKSVCLPGEIAVATKAVPFNTGGVSQHTDYSGAVLNGADCQTLAANGNTQNPNQWCNGGYSDPFRVNCYDGSTPNEVYWGDRYFSCRSNTDRSCDAPGFVVGVCCMEL
ncbi:hypothetical protein GE09DRAFT_1246759 [Coniochaeta sp. 2T2.1]|nr:hypothetical protein GE09DRAFT_1246759 [Coniochaeta sp. 2T2.1]